MWWTPRYAHSSQMADKALSTSLTADIANPARATLTDGERRTV